MKKLKIAVIGTGSISHSHIQAYLKNENVELYALCDVNGEALRKAGERYGIERLYTDEAEMLKMLPEIDAVSVCTWNCAHAPCTIMALEAGKPLKSSMRAPLIHGKVESFPEFLIGEAGGVAFEVRLGRVFRHTACRTNESHAGSHIPQQDIFLMVQIDASAGHAGGHNGSRSEHAHFFGLAEQVQISFQTLTAEVSLDGEAGGAAGAIHGRYG